MIVPLGSGALNGISFLRGTELDEQDCEITRMDHVGIYAEAPNSHVSIRSTAMRKNVYAGFLAHGALVADLDHVYSSGSSVFAGVYAAPGAGVTVTNSVLANNFNGAAAQNSGTQLTVPRSTITGNTNGLAVNDASISLVSDSNVITKATTAFAFLAAGVIYTSGKNTVGYIGQVVTPGHALTPLNSL